jgi:hypothetical protein
VLEVKEGDHEVAPEQQLVDMREQPEKRRDRRRRCSPRPAMAGHTEGGARVPGSDATARDHRGQINQGGVVAHGGATKSPNSPVPKRTGSSRRRAAMQRHRQELEEIRETERWERAMGVGGQTDPVHST